VKQQTGEKVMQHKAFIWRLNGEGKRRSFFSKDTDARCFMVVNGHTGQQISTRRLTARAASEAQARLAKTFPEFKPAVVKAKLW